MIVLSNDIKKQILRCAILIEQCVTRTGIFADMGAIIPAPANVISERFSSQAAWLILAPQASVKLNYKVQFGSLCGVVFYCM